MTYALFLYFVALEKYISEGSHETRCFELVNHLELLKPLLQSNSVRHLEFFWFDLSIKLNRVYVTSIWILPFKNRHRPIVILDSLFKPG